MASEGWKVSINIMKMDYYINLLIKWWKLSKNGRKTRYEALLNKLNKQWEAIFKLNEDIPVNQYWEYDQEIFQNINNQYEYANKQLEQKDNWLTLRDQLESVEEIMRMVLLLQFTIKPSEKQRN